MPWLRWRWSVRIGSLPRALVRLLSPSGVKSPQNHLRCPHLLQTRFARPLFAPALSASSSPHARLLAFSCRLRTRPLDGTVVFRGVCHTPPSSTQLVLHCSASLFVSIEPLPASNPPRVTHCTALFLPGFSPLSPRPSVLTAHSEGLRSPVSTDPPIRAARESYPL